jgi:hypothetical protein
MAAQEVPEFNQYAAELRAPQPGAHLGGDCRRLVAVHGESHWETGFAICAAVLAFALLAWAPARWS